MIADFEAYLLRLISSPPLMRLSACGGYCALPHTCIHSQKQHSLLPFPISASCKETQPGWKRSLEFLAGKLSSLQQVNSCPFFLLSLSPGVGKVCCPSLLAGFLQALSSRAQILGIWGMSGCPASFFLYPLCLKGLETAYGLFSALLYTPTS